MTTSIECLDATPAYKAPTLTVYGNVVALTAAGSGTARESAPGQNCSTSTRCKK